MNKFFPLVFSSVYLMPRVTRRVPLVKQEIFTLPEHRSSRSFLSWLRATEPFILLCNMLSTIACHSVPVLLVIVLCVLRNAASYSHIRIS